jgi:hypothetical protein
MPIQVELFGIPRHRAGIASLSVEAGTLGDALLAAGQQAPELAASCLEGPRLQTGYLASLNGRRFVSDPLTPLCTGDCLLILSSDVGG